jgi:putative flippase GtrA
VQNYSLSSLLQAKLIRFAGVGASSTIIDIAVLKLLLLLHVNVYVATALGFLAGLTNGYLLNSRYVFTGGMSRRSYTRYFIVSMGGLGLTELLIFLFHVKIAHLSGLEAKVVAIPFVFSWNYSLSKLWAFKES